jgi:hypothetical protein
MQLQEDGGKAAAYLMILNPHPLHCPLIGLPQTITNFPGSLSHDYISYVYVP